MMDSGRRKFAEDGNLRNAEMLHFAEDEVKSDGLRKT